MGEMVNKINKYSIQIKGKKITGKQRLIISHEEKGTIIDKIMHGTIKDINFYALGFIDGENNS